MPLQYKPTKHAFNTEGETLTEQEHKESCDINRMIKDAHRGLPIRGSSSEPRFGYDDLTMDSVSFRIQKEKLERELSETASEVELDDEELKNLPKNVREKFKFKQKKPLPKAPKNDDSNDEKPEPITPPPKKPS